MRQRVGCTPGLLSGYAPFLSLYEEGERLTDQGHGTKEDDARCAQERRSRGSEPAATTSRSIASDVTMLHLLHLPFSGVRAAYRSDENLSLHKSCNRAVVRSVPTADYRLAEMHRTRLVR